MPGYNLAALAIFAVPWGIGTVVGLSCRVLEQTPSFPTYPNPIPPAEVNSGFVLPYTIKTVIGTSGLVGFLIMIFMALTSTVSSSMIAVSSILSYDLFKQYIRPNAPDRAVVRVSHLGVVAHAVLMTAVALAFNVRISPECTITLANPLLSMAMSTCIG